MKRSVRCMIWGWALVALLAVEVAAVPAFARKYQMSCKVCHSPFPRLKAYGDEFAANGFVLKDKESPRYFKESGDNTLSLLREIPLALRVEGQVQFNQADAARAEIAAPYLVKLLSGGSLGKGVAYYFYFFFSERGEVAGLEDAFLMFNDLFGLPIDLYVGQFQVSDPLFKRELRLSFEDYQVYRMKPGLSAVNLTYDRGVMLTAGLAGGTDFALQVVNGCGIGAADSRRLFDTDAYKNLMGRVSQDIGEHLRLGLMGYVGKEKQAERTSSVWMAGADATVSVGDVELNLQYVERRDTNPFFTAAADPPRVASRGLMAEALFTPRGDDGKWYGVALFNWVDSDDPTQPYTALTAHAGYLLTRNIRIGLELTELFKSAGGKYLKCSLGVVTAF